MIQLFLWGLLGIGTLNVNRKGLGKKLAEWKKNLTKDYNPRRGRKNTKVAGFEKGFYQAFQLISQPVLGVVQKDSKVMLYLTNCINSSPKGIVQRYDKASHKYKEMQC